MSLLTPPTKGEDDVEWGGRGGDNDANANANTHSTNVGQDDNKHKGEGAWETMMPMASDPSAMSNCS